MVLRESPDMRNLASAQPEGQEKVSGFYRVKRSLRGVITHSNERLFHPFLREASEGKRSGPSMELCGTPLQTWEYEEELSRSEVKSV